VKIHVKFLCSPSVLFVQVFNCHFTEFESREGFVWLFIFFVVPINFFGSTCKLSRFGERFRDGQYSLVSFLFAVLPLTVLPVPSHL